MCQSILPSVHFSGMYDGLILRASLQRNKIRSNMLCCTQKWVLHRSFIFWVSPFWNLLPVINCRVVLTKVFLEPDCLHFGQFNFCNSQVCDKRLVNWTAITDYINIEWIYKECKAWFKPVVVNLFCSIAPLQELFFKIAPPTPMTLVLAKILFQFEIISMLMKLRGSLVGTKTNKQNEGNCICRNNVVHSQKQLVPTRAVKPEAKKFEWWKFEFPFNRHILCSKPIVQNAIVFNF